MSDLLPDDAWVNSFLSAPPRPLLNNLQKRLAASTTHVHALAELFKERAAIEQEYATRLGKLARSAESGQLAGKGGNEWDRHSGEEKVFGALVQELQETSSSHSTLSAALRTDYEQPLRDLPSKVVAWRRISDQDASLDKTLKDYEKVSAKLEKTSGKKQAKADSLAGELNQITSQLASLSPMVYTTYQRLDEERLRAIKEIVVRWGTLRADIAQQDGTRADQAVASLIGWETSDEVQSVGRRLGGAGGGANSRAASAAPTLSAAGTPTSNRRMSTVNNGGGGGADFSPRPTPRSNGSSGIVPTSGFAGGLKSMLGRKGTVAGRQRSGSEATSTRSARRGEADLLGDDIPPMPAAVSRHLAPNADGQRPSQVDDEGFSVAPSDRHRAPWDEPSETIMTPTLAPMSAAPAAPPVPAFAQTFGGSPAASTDSVPATATSPTTASGAPRLNLALSTEPIRESDAEREAAVARMQQSLQLPAAQPNRRSTIARGRRDVRNTMFAPAGEALPGMDMGAPLSASPELTESPTEHGFGASSLNGNGPTARAPGLSRNGSLNPFDSPSLSAPLAPTATGILANGPATDGLRASMAETINVLFKAGAISRIQVTGEIYVSLRGAAAAATTPVHLRLTSFETLEKVAPNPAYLAQVPERPGEYLLDPARLAADGSGGAGAKGTLLFKYQVHVPTTPGASDALVPLTLTPAFQVKDGETRMILTYTTRRPLADLVLSALFGPEPAVNNVQAKPAGGVWSPSARRMTWRIGTDGSEGGKIVARFVTEPGSGELQPASVSAGFAVRDGTVSGLGIEVVAGADALGGGFVEVRKGAVAGKYAAEAVVN